MEHSIRNFDALAENDLRRDALAIAEAGYAAINVGNALRSALHITNDNLEVRTSDVLTSYSLVGRRVFFVGVGKCAFAAASAIEEIFGDRLAGGIALDAIPLEALRKSDIHSSCGCLTSSSEIERIVGTHPLPSEANERASERIISLLSARSEQDLVIMIISGGGSTLLCSPEAPMTCTDESTLFKELTARGATIQDMNIVRKHLSRARGGGLARAAYPAEVISLIVSDVPGDDIAFVASGPTILDRSTVEDACAILVKYGIALPANVSFIETEKEGHYFERVTNTLLLASRDALEAMRREAERLGYTAEVADEHFVGEAREVGRGIVQSLHDTAPKTALLYAGESTVTISGDHGSGGRNQELALAALAGIQGDELVMSFASDGHDNTDHAGAIADATTRARASMQNLSIEEHLDAHRSYDFFTTTQDALLTGYTGSNVSDLIIALKK